MPVCWLLVQAVTRLLPGRLLPVPCQVHGMNRDPMESSLCACLGTLCMYRASLCSASQRFTLFLAPVTLSKTAKA